MHKLPAHLQKYVVEQNYEKYTPVDHAVWRYILRQLRAFLSVHGHECYLEGLEKTGISIEQIPKISDISAKLEKFGWRALPVSGFIPPAAFMELQSLGVLPIASDMRSIEHLLYTPAPDIVHEAAGHAPILIHPEFANYLRQYATVARKAILSKEDLDLYESIRILSDLKENPNSLPEEIQKAEMNLKAISKNMSHVSEAAELSRMNWWTAEYGLIGNMENPKIFGAGLLSSVGESRWCLSEKVTRIPFSIECLKTSYDITEPQPQLFVAKDFKNLVTVLEEMATHMAFRVGGRAGLQKAIDAKSINTAELSTGLQISGVFCELLSDNSNKIIFLKTIGPTQLCYADHELEGQSSKYHSQGYSTPLGPCNFNREKLQLGGPVDIVYDSGFHVQGVVKSVLQRDNKILLITLATAQVTFLGRTYFEPSWGDFDLAFAENVVSVYGGPADRQAFGEMDDFVAARVTSTKYDDQALRLHQKYREVRELRTRLQQTQILDSKIIPLLENYRAEFPHDWLLSLELYEIVKQQKDSLNLQNILKQDLDGFAKTHPEKKQLIDDGIKLSDVL